MINFKIFTLFPDAFPGILGSSVTGNALKKNFWDFEAINIRDYANNIHKTVDDEPYGGGAGMLLKPDILSDAIDKNVKKGSKIIYLSPRGKVFDQKMAINLAKNDEIALICGRYEGIDQRVIVKYDIEEVSIGDYILSGGELAAYVLIDSVLRNVDGVLGQKDSLKEESFSMSESEYLLEYPHYTRPKNFDGLEVPEVLLSGNHAEIEKWRLEKSVEITKERRHDLYQKYINSKKLNDE